MSKTPLHALPHGKLLAKLDEITNFRVVRDEESPTGWKTEIAPFPGWETVPEWCCNGVFVVRASRPHISWLSR